MNGEDAGYDCKHFALSNALDDRPSDLPHLLRRVAAEMEALEIQAMDFLDVTISQEMTADRPWWSAHVYWSPDTEAGDGTG